MRLQDQNKNITEFEIRDSNIFLGSDSYNYDVSNKNAEKATISLGRKKYKTSFIKVKDKIFVNLDGRNYSFDIIEDDDLFEKSATNLDKAEIRPPMPGSVVDLIKSAGDNVDEGDPLIIVEAMKMETTLFSPIKGKITEINISKGQQLTGDEILIVVEKN